MRVLFEMGHPAHVHLFKYTARNLIDRGHDVKICIREREEMVGRLLDAYGFEYEPLQRTVRGLFNKGLSMFKNDIKLLRIARSFRPDIFAGVATPYSAQVSRMIRRPFIAFTDSEPIGLILLLTMPFTDAVITPVELGRDFGEKHVRIRGYKELAYLHPDVFRPDPGVREIMGVSEGERYAVLRFGAFDASHDIGIRGFSLDDKRRLLHALEKYMQVFISSEMPLPPDIEERLIKIPPERMHDALAFASILVTDTQTSTTEAACLGVPAVRCNTFVGPGDMSNFVELEKKYGLIFNYRDPEDAMRRACDLAADSGVKEAWSRKRERLLSEKIDVTAFMTWFIESYPKSLRAMRSDPSADRIFMSRRGG